MEYKSVKTTSELLTFNKTVDIQSDSGICSNTLLQEEESGLIGETADARAGAENTSDKLELILPERKKDRVGQKDMGKWKSSHWPK